MDIACQRGQIFDVLHVRLVVQYALIQVRDAPTQGDVIVEQLRQLCRCLTRVRVTPCTERHQNLLVGIECHVSVHHGRETDTCQLLYLAVVLWLHVLAQVGIAVLQALPDNVDAIRPKSIHQLVLPLEGALGNRFILLVDEHGLDTCGTELDSQDGLTGLDGLFCLFYVHIIICVIVSDGKDTKKKWIDQTSAHLFLFESIENNRGNVWLSRYFFVSSRLKRKS